MTTMVVERHAGVQLDRGSSLQEAAATVERLLDSGTVGEATDALTDARARAEAASLFAQRAGHYDDERHYGKLRLLAEAGLGVLSLNGHLIEASVDILRLWRVLGAGFERGVLLEFCDESTSYRDVARALRKNGYMFVPGKALPKEQFRIGSRKKSVRWWEARQIIRDLGLDPKSFPPDTARVQAEANARAEAARTRASDVKRYRDADRRQRVTRLVKDYPEVAKAYGFIRSALDALDGVEGLPPHRKTALNEAFTHLYAAEDAIAAALRVA